MESEEKPVGEKGGSVRFCRIFCLPPLSPKGFSSVPSDDKKTKKRKTATDYKIKKNRGADQKGSPPLPFNYYCHCRFFSAHTSLATSSGVVNTEGENLTVPESRVPSLRWARGAQ